jgi:predicted deacetylase
MKYKGSANLMPSTVFLLRFDDICPTMNWRIWFEVDELLLEQNIKPIIAIIPDNKDQAFLIEKEKEDFWSYVKERQKIGWTIGVHGYQHLCVTRNKGILGINSCSEFAGLSEEEQGDRIARALEIFRANNVKPDLFVAPWHSFDQVTLRVLRKHGIDVVSDGFSLRPYVYYDVLWIPQQLWWFPKKTPPIGVWTILFHHNFWRESELKLFKADLEKFRNRIADPATIITRYRSRRRSLIDRMFEYFWRKILHVE